MPQDAYALTLTSKKYFSIFLPFFHLLYAVKSRVIKRIIKKQTLKEDRHYDAKMIECSKETSTPQRVDITESASF